MSKDAMTASRDILVAERSGALRHYPSLPALPEQSADHHQKVRDETQRCMAKLNAALNQALARHQPFNPLICELMK